VVTVSVRREVVSFFKSRGHSERRACVLSNLRRSTCRYKHRRPDGAELLARLRQLASERPRFGYRRLHVLLQREGVSVNRKRVYRLYRAAGLTVRRRSRRKLRAARPLPIIALERPNQRWSMDFVHDYLADGRRLRTFNVVDAFTRECLAIEVDFSLPSARVIRVLDKLVWQYGLPESLRVDNGPEFISVAMDRWAFQHGVRLDFIQPGKPTQNAHVESFNGHFRDECLAQSHFPTLNATSRTPSSPRVSPSRASSCDGFLGARAAIMLTLLHARRSDSGSSARATSHALRGPIYSQAQVAGVHPLLLIVIAGVHTGVCPEGQLIWHPMQLPAPPPLHPLPPLLLPAPPSAPELPPEPPPLLLLDPPPQAQVAGVQPLLLMVTTGVHSGVCPAAQVIWQPMQLPCPSSLHPLPPLLLLPAPPSPPELDPLPATHAQLGGHTEHWGTGVAPEQAIAQLPQVLLPAPHPAVAP